MKACMLGSFSNATCCPASVALGYQHRMALHYCPVLLASVHCQGEDMGGIPSSSALVYLSVETCANSRSWRWYLKADRCSKYRHSNQNSMKP